MSTLRHENPRLGVSLPPGYLSGKQDIAEYALYGPPQAFLAEIAAAAATSVEVRAITPGTDVERAKAALECVWEAGLNVTLHGALPPPESEDDWTIAMPALFALLQRLRDEKAPLCPVTLHSYAAPDGDAPALAEMTVRQLDIMARRIEDDQIPVKIALEINRAKATVDPSITYQGVLDMYERTGHPRVGICWDFGHTWANILTQGLEREAPETFVSAVIHTHIHDLGASGRTHWPLTEQRLPLDYFVQTLQRAGYNGVWNLELSPERYRDEVEALGEAPDGVLRRTLASIGRLRETIQTAHGQS